MITYSWVSEYERELGPFLSTDSPADVLLDIERFDPEYVEELIGEQGRAATLRDVAEYLATRPTPDRP